MRVRLATIDGGNVAPARLRHGEEAPHPTYPFFAYNAAYYKPLRGRASVRTFRHKDYASAALSHRALYFDCILVAKLKDSVGAHTFWMDPSHLRPIPPDLFKFYLEVEGFRGVGVRTFEPSPYTGSCLRSNAFRMISGMSFSGK